MKSIGLKLSTTSSLFIFLGFLIAVFSITSEHFLSPYNITSLLTNISYSGIAAIVLTLIIISRGLDISIGGVIGLTTVVVATLYSQNDPLPTWLILIIGLSTGAIVGFVNGWCITALDMDPIITTLGAMAITRGLAYVISDSQSILMFEDTTDYISNGTILYIPIPIIIFILTVIIFSVLLHKSKFGRAVYAIGANELSAEFSGIAIKSKKMILYILSGVAASISGIILLGQTSVGMPQHGLGTELEVITAVLLGGTALSGGKGTIFGTVAGVLILGVLFNGLTISGVRYVHLQIFQGILLLVAVATYEIKTRNEVAR
ncbi:ABC transporter permease [Candidatus Thioglobus sp.]|nr:ribose ABC transporter permease [Paracoccaceae bacterium]MDC0075389.1 ABC transporter permease [Candidatus Thioglobus sp.]|tara:strand:+ start:1142 stop:2095 length:954 start_codon:yes stop_codon:yes gene_type:complete